MGLATLPDHALIVAQALHSNTGETAPLTATGEVPTGELPPPPAPRAAPAPPSQAQALVRALGEGQQQTGASEPGPPSVPQPQEPPHRHSNSRLTPLAAHSNSPLLLPCAADTDAPAPPISTGVGTLSMSGQLVTIDGVMAVAEVGRGSSNASRATSDTRAGTARSLVALPRTGLAAAAGELSPMWPSALSTHLVLALAHSADGLHAQLGSPLEGGTAQATRVGTAHLLGLVGRSACEARGGGARSGSSLTGSDGVGGGETGSGVGGLNTGGSGSGVSRRRAGASIDTLALEMARRWATIGPHVGLFWCWVCALEGHQT